ncbi:MAG: hypothetical protein ACPGYV_00995 [Phycisphaeraceae bacterium]
MATDQQVSARAILRAESELRRVGHRQTMTQLEQVEPDLSGHLWEELSDIHRRLLSLGGSPKASQRCYRRIQRLMLVAILALRHGHHELWRDLHGPEEEPEPENK